MTALRDMTDAEFAAWRAQSIHGYAADKVRSGRWLAEESLSRAEEELAQLLPDGMHSAGHHFFTIEDVSKTSVGAIWIAQTQRTWGPIAYVYDLVVWPEHQRLGHGERAMRTLEIKVQDMGLSGLALHVFGHNERAQALYRKLGYAPTNINLFKPLGTRRGSSAA